MRIPSILFILLFSFLLIGCATHKIKNISYLPTLSSVSETEITPTLSVFTPKKVPAEKMPVLIFVHGGNWNSGSKELYGFFGRNFAKKGVVTVIPGYTLSPNATYDEMTQQIAAAIVWTKENIEEYHGDSEQIFLTGHSAGGHLIALATMNPKYAIEASSISGMIFNDAAGLDMKHYLEENPPTQENNYITTWTTNPEIWKDASPIYFISEKTPPIMVYLGSKTYNSIKVGNQRFLEKLKPFQPTITPIVLDKKHVPMMVQYFWPWSHRYDEIIDFITQQK